MRPALAAGLVTLGVYGVAVAASEQKPLELELYGDFRARFEADFDSSRADGSERDDRDRVRARLRAGVELRRGEHLALGLRLRSGSDANHQSPHITLIDLDDNDTGEADFNLDRWYLVAKSDQVTGRIGRDRLPFWRQNELLWDDDVTVAGVFGSYEQEGWTVHALAASPPVGMRDFSGLLTGGQLVRKVPLGGFELVAAAGVLELDPAAADEDAGRLRNGNGMRDYRIWSGSVRLAGELGRVPVALGVDRHHNGRRYSATDPDPFTAANRDRRDGWAVSLFMGGTAPGRWQGGYTYASIETLAVIASYAEDDWVRWGSADETEGSDLRGHELRLARGLTERSRLVARLYLVEAIASSQDGKRFRLDYDVSF